MALVNAGIQTETCIQENSDKINEKDLASTSLRMELEYWDLTKKICFTGFAKLCFQTRQAITDSLRTAKWKQRKE